MRKILYIFIVLSVIAFALVFTYNKVFFSKKKLKTDFEITKGETIKQIAKRLENQKIIDNRLIFEIGVRVFKKEKHIKAGYYSFNGFYNVKEIINQLTKGSSKLKKITFPEGLTCFEVFDKLCKAGFGDKQVYLDYFYHPASFLPEQFKKAETLEGFLFPETYFFREKASEKEIIKEMVKLFLIKFNSIKKPEKQILTPYKSVILASLIEKETNGKNEEKIIASVFLNRLKKKMKLQCDPTIIYALILEGKYDGNIRKKDINMENRFNTYYIQGLPPTPIANPGLKALQAVFYPDKTDYLYFVSKNNGTHIFSKTYKEHSKNVIKYQIKHRRKRK